MTTNVGTQSRIWTRMVSSSRTLAVLATTSAALLLAGCERPPMQSRQQGPNGSGMVQIDNPRILAKAAAATPAVPVSPPAPPEGGPLAKDAYQNVKVLGHLSVGDFTRHMVAITEWVAPKEGPEAGCLYCHGANLADDSKYTKVVSRRMMEMTQHLNGDWGKHVGATGVTCYTCHRGAPVPANVWFAPAPSKGNRIGAGFGDDAGQNKAEPSIALASLPYDPLTPYLSNAEPIRVAGEKALPHGNRASIKQAEHTYSLMNHMSQSLGVNCTFCHNTQSFQSWDGPATRATAWYGIRMARDLNVAYMEPLTKTFPAHRLGVTGDVAKVGCGTCHQGANKPLNGLAMAKDFKGLQKVATVAAATGAAAPAAAVAAAPVATAVAPTAAAPGNLPPAVSEAARAIVYFAVGSPKLEASQSTSMAQLIETMKAKANTTATISGFHSASGTLATNQELAKQRAFAVRDALQAGGIDPGRVKLEKPVQTEANVAGEDATSRRVEITVQ
jgi:photosynthetic reaction center cytochrome c subunit